MPATTRMIIIRTSTPRPIAAKSPGASPPLALPEVALCVESFSTNSEDATFSVICDAVETSELLCVAVVGASVVEIGMLSLWVVTGDSTVVIGSLKVGSCVVVGGFEVAGVSGCTVVMSLNCLVVGTSVVSEDSSVVIWDCIVMGSSVVVGGGMVPVVGASVVIGDCSVVI